MSEDQLYVSSLPMTEVSSRLGLSHDAVQALIQSGFLHSMQDGSVDESGIDNLLALRSGDDKTISTADELMDELDERTRDLARMTYERFARVIPDAASWNEEERNLFIEQSEGRFGAILAVMSQGSQIDGELRHDLEDVGASAAWSGTSLPHLLLVLRISRDLLLQTALRLTNAASPNLVGAFAARMLPAIDRLTDSLTDGYWSAKLDQQQDEWHRFENLIEGCSYGVYEADLDGTIRYANQTFCNAIGREQQQVVGQPLNEVLVVDDRSVLNSLLSEPANDAVQLHATIQTTQGELPSRIDVIVRRVNSQVVGFGAIINFALNNNADFGNARAAAKADTSEMVPDMEELRRALTLLGDAGAFLDRNAETMTADRVHQAGKSIRRQSERLSVIVDQLDEVRRRL